MASLRRMHKQRSGERLSYISWIRTGLAPILGFLSKPYRTLRSYDASAVKPDLIAGLTVAIIALPQAMAYALIAELPPQTGLYAVIVGAVIGALWGSSNHLQTGPTNTTSLIVLSALLAVAQPGTPTYLVAAGLMAVIVGAIQPDFKAGDALIGVRVAETGAAVGVFRTGAAVGDAFGAGHSIGIADLGAAILVFLAIAGEGDTGLGATDAVGVAFATTAIAVFGAGVAIADAATGAVGVAEVIAAVQVVVADVAVGQAATTSLGVAEVIAAIVVEGAGAALVDTAAIAVGVAEAVAAFAVVVT